VVVAALFALALPLAAAAKPGGESAHAYVAPELAQAAAENPQAKLPVIVQSVDGTAAAANAVSDVSASGSALGLVDGVSATVRGASLDELASQPGLRITPDAPVVLDGKVSAVVKQDWPHVCGCQELSRRYRNFQPTTIAIVDSGIDTTRPEFAGRIEASVDFTSGGANSPGDGYGHGTFVAGIAASSAGVAPTAPIVSLDVINDAGEAKTSDVIRAIQWILANKARYGIGVANLSLHEAEPSSFRYDPLDKAVEQLWFSGVVVVTSAGNYGSADGPSGVVAAPANDPFVLTVGALDAKGRPADDTATSWSAYGYTPDGFAKPELAAPGRGLVGPIPPGSTLAQQRPEQVVAPGYIVLSGTSFAAPVVSGVAAYLRAIHPDWAPDQVKGALMASAVFLPKAAKLSVGMGGVNAVAAAGVTAPPNPNLSLDRFLVPVAGAPLPVFDSDAWTAAAQADPHWDAPTWNAPGWRAGPTVSWSDVSWADVSWADVSWADVSWSDVSWSDVAWADVGP
jgi:serine protease AprX